MEEGQGLLLDDEFLNTMIKRLKTWLVSLFMNVHQSGRMTQKNHLMGVLTGALVGLYLSLLKKGSLPIENSGVAGAVGVGAILGVMFVIVFIRAKIVREKRKKEQAGE